jgi:uncharacterized repeat protein (TIGR01451 family)
MTLSVYPKDARGLELLCCQRNAFPMNYSRLLTLLLAVVWSPVLLRAQAPVITAQPVGQTTVSGTNLVLSVTATGAAPLRYQWRVNSTNYVGATNETLTISNITFLNGGPYRVVVTNSSGVVTSDVAVVNIDQHLTFRLTEILPKAARWIDHNNLTGDDRGGVVVSGGAVFVTGDNTTARYNSDTLANGVGLGTRLDAVCNNLRDEKIYTLANGTTPINYGLNFTTVNSLIEIDPLSGGVTGNRITLSSGVSINTSSILFSGWDRIVIYNGSRVFNIALPSGRVTDMGSQPFINRNYSESWASWGIAEYFDNAVHLVYVQDYQTIARRRALTSTVTTAARFTNIGETASIAFSPSLSRWFFHHEGSSQFTGDQFPSEVLGSAKASYTLDVNYPLVLTNPISHSVYIDSNTVFRVVATGGEPLDYQWLFNGQEIPGATGSSLSLTNIQPTNAGNYSVRISNPVGILVSSEATLTVITTPFIVAHPQSRSVFAGSNTIFSASANGAPPMTLQWMFNGLAIAGATNSNLTLTNIQTSLAGMYTLRASNRFGTALSLAAELFVATVIDDGSVFQVTSITTNGARTVDGYAITDYGLGSIAASASNLFYTGYDGTGRFPLDTLAGGARITRTYQALVSNLRTERIYTLANGATPLDEGGSVTTLLEVDGVTGQLTGGRIDLSAPINATDQSGFFDSVGIYSGYDRVVIHNNSHVYNIALPSGRVTDLGYLGPRSHNYSIGWAYWGVAEHVNGIVYLLHMRDYRTIARARVPDGLTTTVTQYQNSISFYLASFTVSIPRNRWYFEYPYGGSSTFPSFNQTVGYANATFAIDSGSNVDHFEWDPIPTVQSVNVPFPARLTARTTSGSIATNFSGTVTLSARRAADNAALSVLPISVSTFVSGVWTGQVSVLQPASAVYLQANDQDGNTGQSSVFSVSPANDLVVQITDAPDPVLLGQNVTYTILVTNTGPATATAVILTNTLPANALFVAAAPSQGSCTNNGNIVRCELGTVPTGVRVEVAVTATPTALGGAGAQATLTRGETDADPSNNSATTTTLVTNPSLSITDVTVQELDSGTNTVDFTVRLSSPSTNTVRVNFSAANGTAASPLDFTARSGTVIFAPGSTNEIISIGVRGDISYETNEIFYVNLSGPQNAVLADNQGSCTIFNDDAAPQISITDVSLVEGNSGTNNAVFRVWLSSPNGLPVVVRYATGNGTARAGSDFVGRNGTITFSPGTPFLTQSVTIQVRGDALAEPNEIFYVNLSSPTNAILARAQGTGTIQTDEGIGMLNAFAWEPITSPQPVNTPFAATIRAVDVLGTVISNFNGTASLRGAIGQPQIEGTLFGDAAHNFSEPSGPYTFGIAFTPSVNMTVTHVRHYTGTKMSIWTDTGTVLAVQDVASAPGAWTETPLDTPLPLLAGTTYRVCHYTGPDPYYYTTNLPSIFEHGIIGEMYYTTADNFPDILLGGLLFLGDLRYTIGTPAIPVAISPSITGPFTEGVWTGLISVLSSATNMHVEADDGQGHVGESAPFDAGSAPLLILSGPDDQSVVSGNNATFQVQVSGVEPISYQWYFNETNALAAITSTLTISDVSIANGGLYSLVVSNSSGSVTSRLATLSVDDHLTFRILSLRTNAFIAIEHNGISGDDRGCLAVSSNFVFYTGDSALGRWNISTLTGGTDVGRFADSLVTDLRTETVYSLANGNTELTFGGTITSLLELNQNGTLSGRRIDLSSAIPVNTGFGQVGIFAGMGRIVIHNRTNAYSIAIPSGVVTDLGPGFLPVAPSTESWAFWGIAEYFDNAVHLVYVEGTFPRRNIIRTTLTSGTTSTVAQFTNLADMAVIAFSPSQGRWFFHYEGTGQFRSGDETLGSAKASFTTDPGFPTIVRSPVSQTNFPGGTVTFTVLARGTAPLGYQWFFNGTPISGATSDSLTLTNITTQRAGAYTVEVNNLAGSVLSSAAVLTIYSTPIVRAGPLHRTVYPGDNTTFSVVADGAPPLWYQWRHNGAPISTTTNATLLLTNVQPSQAGLYSVRVTNIYGAAVSTNATLTVITTPFIIQQPQLQANFVGSNVTFSVIADGAPPLFYQWRFNATPIAGATNATLLLTNIQLTDAGNYSVVVSNQYGSVTSTLAELIVFGDAETLGSFQITSLRTNGCKIVDHNDLTSDDRGGVAVSRTHVYVTGDARTARYNAADLTAGIAVGTFPIDSMVTDLRTETVYLLGNGTNVIVSGEMTTLIEMDANGNPTTRRIPLSRPVPLQVGFTETGIFAGYGRIAIYNGDHVYNILLPSGIVQDLGPFPAFQHHFSESWAFWGVTEHVGSVLYLAFVEDFTTIVRLRVPDGQRTVIASFESLSDMASFVVSPSRRRWYFHYEGGAQFGGSSETLGYCDATFSIRSGTGLDHFEWGPIGPVQAVNSPFTVTLTALNASNQVVTNFNGPVSLSGVSLAGGGLITISPNSLSNFVNGLWTGQVRVLQASPGMFLRADDQIGVTGDSPAFSVNVANDLVVSVSDSPDPAIVGDALTYSILVTNIGPNPATAVTLTNILATNLVFVSVSSSQGTCTNEGRIVRCDLGALPGGSGVTVTVVTVPIAGGLTASQFSATRGEGDPNLANNSVTVQTLVTVPSIAIADATIGEGDVGTNDVNFVLTLTPASTNTIRVNFSTANGTATGSGSAADYVPRSGTVIFLPGSTSQVVTVGIRGDRIFENDETLLLNLTAPVNAMIDDNQGVATIVNDDPLPMVSITDVTVTEGNTGATNAVFRVSLSGGSGLPVIVTYEVAAGTATPGVDLTNRFGQITFTAGTLILTQSLPIQVYGDLTPEPHETFFLNLTSVQNATLAREQGIGTIRNDDGLGVLHHFEWDTILSPQQPGVPFPTTITARDVSGTLVSNYNSTLVSNYNSTVSLLAQIPSPQPSNSILGNIVHTHEVSGDWTLGYSFTPTNEMRVTHVRHYFGTKVSIWTEDGGVLAVQQVVSTPGTWRTTRLTNELVLQAGMRYRVAAYTGNSTYYFTFGGVTNFPHGILHDGYEGSGDTFPGSSDGVQWWFVDLLYTGVGYASAPIVMPQTSGTFSNGTWSGELTVTQAVAGTRLEARQAGPIIGLSNPFDVSEATDANLTLRIYGTNHVHTGSNILVRVAVTNRGPASATSVIVTNTIPDGFQFVSAVPTQGSCSNDATRVICNLGPLFTRVRAEVDIVLQAGPTGTATFLASAGAPQMDPYKSNNAARLDLTIYRDTDSDGMWDEWETANGFALNNPGDAGIDTDGDGHTNLQEFQSETNPHNAASVKLFTRISVEGDQIILGFRGALGQRYRVERANSLGAPVWVLVSEFLLDTANEVELTDTSDATVTRCYRAMRLP